MQAALLGRAEPDPSCEQAGRAVDDLNEADVFVASQMAGFPFEFHARLHQIPRQACSEKMKFAGPA